MARRGFLGFGLLGLLLLSPALRGQERVTRTITIPDGTIVPLQLMDNLSSKTSKSDDPVRFKVREDVRVEGKVVIPFGSPGVGRVAMVGGRGMAGKAGSVNFAVDYVKAADGTNVRVRGSPKVSGGGNTSVAAASAIAYSPAALLVMRGSHAEIHKGTMFSVYVDGDRQVKVTTYAFGASEATSTEPAAAPAPPATAPEPTSGPGAAAPTADTPAEELSTVVMKSTPTGAEITVDGKFIGSTPSTVQLAPGEHAIAIEKEGFKPWQRTLTVRSGGVVNIDAQMEKSE